MANTINVNILGDSKGLARALGDSQSRLGKFGDKVNRMGRVMNVGLLAVGAGVAVLAKGAVNAASEAQQSIGATESIFGKYADTVVKTSDRAAQAFGLSANDYRESSNLLGSLFKNQGVSLDKLSGSTKKHVGLASDLSAMYGGPVTDAVDALTAAYKGEFNQLEKYGVTLKQDTINTEAGALAKKRYGRALDDLGPKQQSQLKQLATQRLLFSQTTDAQGTFAKESNTLAGQQQRLAAEFENVKVKIGEVLLPILTKLMKYISREGVPQLEKFAKWFKSEGPQAIDKVTNAIKDIWPYVQKLLSFMANNAGTLTKLGAGFVVVTNALRLLNPLMRTANLVGGAMNTMFGRTQTAAAGAGTAVGTTGTRMNSLRTNVRGLAGVAGIGALAGSFTTAATKGNSLGSVLSGTVGGAMTGLAVGGPIGALIGGVAGGGLSALIGAFSGTTDESKKAEAQLRKTQALEQHRQKVNELKDTLNQTTGAFTKMSDAMIWNELQTNKDNIGKKTAIDYADQLSISHRTLLKAAKGNPAAVKWLKNYGASLPVKDVTEFNRLLDSLGITQDVVTDGQKQWQNQNRATAPVWRLLRQEAGLTKKEFLKWPENVRTKIDMLGVPKSLSDINKLDDALGPLTKRQATILLKAAGIKPTEKAVNNLMDRVVKDTKSGSERANNNLGKTGNVKPSGKWLGAVTKAAQSVTSASATATKKSNDRLKNVGNVGNSDKWRGAVSRTIGDATSIVRGGVTKANSNMSRIGDAKASRGIVGSAAAVVGDAAAGAKTKASSGGQSVGSNMGSGMYNGIGDWASSIANRAAGVVQAAIAAARVAAAIHSPSRKTRQIGRYLSQGLSVGIKQDAPKAIAAFANVIDKLFDATYKRRVWQRGKKGKRGKWVTETLPLLSKSDKRQVGNTVRAYKTVGLSTRSLGVRYQRVTKYLKGYSNVFKGMGGRIGLNDVARAQNRLNAQIDAARDKLKAARDAWNSYKSAATSSFVDYGNITGLDTPFTAAGITAGLQDKLGQARKFASYIKTLTGFGLNRTTLDQLIQAGPEAGYAYAKALVEAGKGAVGQYNAVQSQLQATANTFGTNTANTMKRAGIQAAQGLLDGLASKKKQLDSIAATLANSLVKTIKKRLGIRSPSRVFKELGKYTVEGLQIGLNDTTGVSNAMHNLSDTVATGFNPRLKANAGIGGTGGDTYNITVQLQAGMSEVEMGRAYTKAIDAFKRNGGRTRAA